VADARLPLWRRLAAPLLACALALVLVGAGAKEAVPESDDPVLEARMLTIAEELRCLVCQNETIAASHADLAVDLRKQIRIKLKAGQSKQEIVDFMVARYGDFVLYRPPFKATTLLLWLGPALLLLVGGLLFWRSLKSSQAAAPAAPVDAADARRAEQLLAAADEAAPR